MDISTNETTAQAATNQATLPAGKLVLIGIFGPKADLEALVRTRRGKIERVKRGMRLHNATISAIAPDRIVLSDGPTTEILTFPDAKSGS